MTVLHVDIDAVLRDELAEVAKAAQLPLRVTVEAMIAGELQRSHPHTATVRAAAAARPKRRARS